MRLAYVCCRVEYFLMCRIINCILAKTDVNLLKVYVIAGIIVTTLQLTVDSNVKIN